MLNWKFQSTPSVWRETCDFRRSCIHAPQFQSTPSVWRETFLCRGSWRVKVFQSTPSVWRETGNSVVTLLPPSISIHSLRVEGDSLVLSPVQMVRFQSTPSVWRETAASVSTSTYATNFNPLPPCGGRRLVESLVQAHAKISIHSLRVEGDRYFSPDTAVR